MKCAVIYNPNSGKARQKHIDYVCRVLASKYDVRAFATGKTGDATKTAKEICKKCDLIVACGGDGTLNEVINGVMQGGGKCKIGLIPKGTVNDVAHSLKIPRSYKSAAKLLLRGKTFKHDIFKVNDRYGIYVCCCGFFTETSYATNTKGKKLIGKAAYALHGLKKAFNTPSFELVLKYDGGEVRGKYAFLLALNSRSCAGFPVIKNAALDDGKVDVMLIGEKDKRVRFPAMIKVFSIFLSGMKTQGLRLCLDKFHVEMPNNVIYDLDGENAGSGSFDFEVIKGGIEIIAGV